MPLVTFDDRTVNEGDLSFSTSETDTGMTWIDEKKIYRKSFQYTGSVQQGTVTNSVIADIYEVVRPIEAVIKTGGTYTTYTHANYYNSASDYYRVFYHTSDGLQVRQGDTTSRTWFITIYYTKTS